MYYGMTNSPGTFQTMMNEIFGDLINRIVVVVYMDDILIFTKTLEEHQQIVNEVLQILKDNHLYLKPEKCIFEVQEIEFLGYIISNGSIHMDPVKVKGAMDWPVPRNVKEVQSFLGFLNFYRHFIEGFSSIAHPLHQLTRKDALWKWDDKIEATFNELKQQISSSPILVNPNTAQPMHIEVDSSGFAMGAVSSQLSDDDKWHPIAYYSKSRLYLD